MSFDYFNNSMLAFGTKITRAFRTLEKLELEAEANVAQVIKDQEVFSEYIDRNYQVARPTRDESPVRTDEVFNILNDKEVYIRRLEYSDNKLRVDLTLFNRSNNRITRLSGETSKKKGYVYFKSSLSNQRPEGTLKFEDEPYLTDSDLLFQYRIDNLGNVNLIGDTSNLSLIPNELIQYNSISKGATLATDNEKYVSKDYQAVCIVGQKIKDGKGHTLINLNGKPIYGTSAPITRYMGFAIVYLKPDDVITGKYSTIFRINYNK